MKKKLLYLLIIITGLLFTDSMIALADSNDYINIKVNPPSEYSYKTKQQIYDIRKKHVSKSIFALKDYTPSNEVFGQIEDNKPWICIGNCFELTDRPKAYVNAPSEESRFVNNPSALVLLEYPYPLSLFRKGEEFPAVCSDNINNLIPTKIRYSKSKKEIEVTFKTLPYNTSNFSFYMFNGINARDFGYRFVYFDSSKSTFIPNFSSPNNISKEVGEFHNFLHLGGSCGVEGGCNNGSPRQDHLEFLYDDKDKSKAKKYMYLKLWKERPSSPEDKADMYEKIIFEEV